MLHFSGKWITHKITGSGKKAILSIHQNKFLFYLETLFRDTFSKSNAASFLGFHHVWGRWAPWPPDWEIKVLTGQLILGDLWQADDPTERPEAASLISQCPPALSTHCHFSPFPEGSERSSATHLEERKQGSIRWRFPRSILSCFHQLIRHPKEHLEPQRGWGASEACQSLCEVRWYQLEVTARSRSCCLLVLSHIAS